MTTLPSGVALCANPNRPKPYRAYATLEKRQHHLGVYPTVDAAQAAVSHARKNMHTILKLKANRKLQGSLIHRYNVGFTEREMQRIERAAADRDQSPNQFIRQAAALYAQQFLHHQEDR